MKPVQAPTQLALSFARVSCLAALLAIVAPCQPVRADAVRAREHFDAGARAFDEHRLADAAREFELAYQAEPAFQVLYNLGTVYAALGDAVAAIDAFERYLQHAEGSAPAERIELVRAELERQRSRIAKLWLTAQPAGAEVRVDAKLVGVTPLEGPLSLSAGRRTIEVSREGFRSERRELQFEARTDAALSLELAPIPRPEPTSPAPIAPAATSPAQRERSTGRAQRAIGWSVAALGLGGLIAGTVVLIDARYKHLDAVDLAERDQRTRAEKLEAAAQRQKTLSYGVLGVAGAVFVTGVIVAWTAPRRELLARLRLSPMATHTQWGLTAQGRF